MRSTVLVVLAGWLWMAAPTASATEPPGTKLPAAQPAEYEPEVSLPLETPAAAWASSGFRFDFGIAWTRLRALPFVAGDSRRITEISIELRPRYRINRWWSAGLLLSYGVTTDLGGLSGSALQWGIGGEAVFHPLRQLGLSLRGAATGLYGEVSNTLEDQPTWLVGLRLDYLIVAGFLFATGPFVHGDLTGPDAPDALPKGRRIFTGSAGWWFSWR